MSRNVRITILLLILAVVAVRTYLDRVQTTDWNAPLQIAVFPISGDGSAVTQQFIRELSVESLQPIETFLQTQARRYRVPLEQLVEFSLQPTLQQLPPVHDASASLLEKMLWSLQTRYWVWEVARARSGDPDIKLLVLFHDPERSPSLPHSIGLQKGLFGIVNVFAAEHMAGSNNVVIAHELLHTLGASDKYDYTNGQPIHPEGYAEPLLEPLHPQSRAEIMGGRIPLNEQRSRVPESLEQVVVGPRTAREIGWIE